MPGDGDPLLAGEEAIYMTESQWIAAAKKSPCAKNIDQQLLDKSEEEREGLKEETFAKIYANMGSEIPPKDLKMAIVLKTPKFHPAMVVFMMTVTLGLFYFFRPKDDDTILVLTENGRVYLLKVERPNVFGSDIQVAFLTFIRLLLFVIAVFMAPTLVWMVFGEKAVGDVGEHFNEESFLEKEIDLDKRMWKKLQKNTAMLAAGLAVTLVMGAVWLYRNWPADYATRSRQSFSASNISSIQYTITGPNYARKLVMRLFSESTPHRPRWTRLVLRTAALQGLSLLSTFALQMLLRRAVAEAILKPRRKKLHSPQTFPLRS